MRDTAQATARYHERTKHQPHAYARSLGYLDWATQPDPFRRYQGAPVFPLAHPPASDGPPYDTLFAGALPAQPVSYQSISQLFFDALALSAWKEAALGNRWSLRVNPSSGDLHPTEGYLVSAPIEGLSEDAAVYHYTPHEHALEQRMALAAAEWHVIAGQLPADGFLIGLTSIYWRESWKYGERAFRYCHHDVGHAIGTVTLAGAVLGWQVSLVNGPSTEDMAVLLGCQQQGGSIEAEHADCLLLVVPDRASTATVRLELSEALLSRLRRAPFAGHPNRLSRDHHEWPIIDQVAAATAYPGQGGGEPMPMNVSRGHDWALTRRGISARRLVHQRRSAVAMDGQTWLDENAFYHILGRATPDLSPFPYDALPWRPRLSLALMVHRVRGLDAGLYLLMRHASHFASLRASLTSEFQWRKPAGCPQSIPLYLLAEGDAQAIAEFISCQQAIASDGVFSLGMLAEFSCSLEEGAWMYPRLFWEAGLIGQILYLEAEAAGIRATGIGCFFDDVMHELLGITDHTWQSLYHFTLGGAMDDPRLKTLPPYFHQMDKKLF